MSIRSLRLFIAVCSAPSQLPRSRPRTPRTSLILTRVELVDVGTVVVLSTGHTTTTRVLAVLANTTVTGADVTPVLARLRETGRHLELVFVLCSSKVDKRPEGTEIIARAERFHFQNFSLRSSRTAALHTSSRRIPKRPRPAQSQLRRVQSVVLQKYSLLSAVGGILIRAQVGPRFRQNRPSTPPPKLQSSMISVPPSSRSNAPCRCRRRCRRHSLCRCGFLMDGSQHTSQSTRSNTPADQPASLPVDGMSGI